MRAWPVLVIVIAGCSKIIGINDVSLGDAGTGSDGAPSNTVVGRSFTHCETAAGNQDVPIDESAAIIAALIPDTTMASGYRTVTGVGRADGTFEIDNVPDGVEYMLKIGRNYYVTTQHSIDNHFDEPVRCTPKPVVPTAAPTINFAIGGMTPFANAPEGVTDTIEVDSFNLIYLGNPTPQDAASTLTLPYNWGDGFSEIDGTTPLPDASAGDDLEVTHLRAEPHNALRKHTFTHVIDTFSQTGGITLTDGGTATVSGTFTPATATKSVVFAVTRGAFDAGWDGTAQFEGITTTIVAHPVVNDFGVGIPVASVDFSDWSRSASLSENVSVSYADPFPATWSRTLFISYTRPRFLLLPGTTTPASAFGGYSKLAPYTGGNPVTSPTLSPPTSVKLADVPLGLGGKVTFDGVGPVPVTWTAVGGAKSYTLLIRRVFANGSQTRAQTVALVSTTNTSVSIPAEVFTGGEFFEMIFEVIQAPANYAAGEINANGVPNQFVEVGSGRFRFTSTCGNGVVDPGEDCDTSGESATCNVDCTTPKCGDGLRNAAAGEECDTVHDTQGCNAGTCKLPRCGDGYRNTVTEDCDDGNTTSDGNGCSADCHFNNVCGNGIVEIGESCDSGGVDTATCNHDCTPVICGDGHRNAAAGEQCDDGNFDDTDHCSNQCKTQ